MPTLGARRQSEPAATEKAAVSLLTRVSSMAATPTVRSAVRVRPS
jgi:hypothetical protein